MPPASRQQQKLIYALRGKYKTKKDTPKKYKWVWEEGFSEPLEESKQEAYERYYEIYDEQVRNVVEDILNGVKEQPWTYLNVNMVKNVWSEFIKYGKVIRMQNALDKIAGKVVLNIVRLDVNSMMYGATRTNPRDEVQAAGYEFPDEKELEDKLPERDPNQLFLFDDYEEDIKKREEEFYQRREELNVDMTWEEFDKITTDYIQYVSDYGREPLVEIAVDILSTDDTREKIMLIDKAFNVVHQQYDLTKIFFRNGSSDYSEISGENFGDNPEEYIPEFKTYIPLFESPVDIHTKDLDLDMGSGAVYAFMWFDGKFIMGSDGMEHADVIAEHHKDYLEYPGDDADIKELENWANHQMKYIEMYHDNKRTTNQGRCWANNLIVSFWEEPKKETILKAIFELSQRLGIQAHTDDWRVDAGFQDDDKRYTKLVKPTEFTRFSFVDRAKRDSEQMNHVMSPLEKAKKKIAVPAGVGSEKGGRPLEYRQKLYQESLRMIKESPDEILLEDPRGDVDEIASIIDGFAFGWYEGELYVAEGEYHADMAYDILDNSQIEPPQEHIEEDTVDQWRHYAADEIRYDLKDIGRLWFEVPKMGGKNIVSFWNQALDKRYQNNEFVIGLVRQLCDKLGHEFNVKEWMKEVGIDDKGMSILVPLSKGYETKDDEAARMKAKYEEHMKSPMSKKPRSVPKGVGSEKPGRPLQMRQKMYAESFVPTIQELKEGNSMKLGRFTKDVTIEYAIDKTYHATFRQGRHGEKNPITDEEIKSLTDRSIEPLTQALVHDKVDIGDRVHLWDTNSNLNIVGQVKNSGENGIKVVVVTVMRTPNFRPSKTKLTLKL